MSERDPTNDEWLAAQPESAQEQLRRDAAIFAAHYQESETYALDALVSVARAYQDPS